MHGPLTIRWRSGALRAEARRSGGSGTSSGATLRAGGDQGGRLRRNRRRQLAAFGLVAPLALFLVVVFVVPILQMLGAAWIDRSVVAGDAADQRRRSAAGIAATGCRAEPVYAAIAEPTSRRRRPRARSPARRGGSTRRSRATGRCSSRPRGTLPDDPPPSLARRADRDRRALGGSRGT
jgi:hypothetical protein